MTDLTQDQLERRELIAQLFGAFGRTPTEANYAGYEAGLKLMQTPTLARVVSTWLEGLSELTDPSEARVPTAGRLWDLRRKLRKLPDPRPLELTPPPGAALDGWDLNANLLLMQYLWGKHGGKGVDRYSPDSRYDNKARKLVTGQQTSERTAIFVKWKNAWSRDMRESRAEHRPLDGRVAWAECMTLAEAELDRYIASQQQAAA
jgi:hypothetical protein